MTRDRSCPYNGEVVHRRLPVWWGGIFPCSMQIRVGFIGYLLVDVVGRSTTFMWWEIDDRRFFF